MGHTFWDNEIWMYPPLLLLHPDLARSAMRYRHERLPAARRIARKYGYEGSRKPLNIFPISLEQMQNPVIDENDNSLSEKTRE